ncbi:acyltransferase [Deinococcus taeanensis]|uniref:acyltransferase n=1 Tax=Deinococcus taeanensis TaxID=2737050 RepID=UPI001CDD1BF8|nr:acyltransferase [Deinococcus taeanensis]UBV42650.1 acyltransferase [Deinococcus taeanensis]
MTWLKPVEIGQDAQAAFNEFLRDLDARLADPGADRYVLAAEVLAQMMYGRSYAQLQADAPLAALNVDARNVTFEAEYYMATDAEQFGRVKPLLWLWKNADLTPVGQNPVLGIPLRRVLAGHVFRRVGQEFKCWQNVEFSVGYNMEVGDHVVVHRHVLLDDIGGIELHDNASISDYVNVYSHTHSVLDGPDVTLKRTVIGRGARVTYHSTVLAGSVISDDAMLATHALLRGDIPPHGIAMGVPARTTRFKLRPPTQAHVDSRSFERAPERKANPEYPEPTPVQTRRPAEEDATPRALVTEEH